MKEGKNLPKKTLKTYKSFFFLNAEMDIVAFCGFASMMETDGNEKKRERKEKVVNAAK